VSENVVCLRIAILVKELFLRCSTKKTKHEKVLHIPDGIGSSTLELSILSELSSSPGLTNSSYLISEGHGRKSIHADWSRPSHVTALHVFGFYGC